EALTGVEMCLACDKPIRDREDSVPYGHVSPRTPAPVRITRAQRPAGSAPWYARRAVPLAGCRP
ncbi:hypothetical protein ABZ904_23805, partial [Streptomyces sp. NPDC046900]|uniref:hypothetical protein n=1 Tax=Streptomyces sp. NPDC046900 TaxID=3155473 RepID=UPI0033EBF437